MKKISLQLLICLLALGCNQPPKDTLVIASAANMQYAMKHLVAAFEKEKNIPCEVILGSSGKLTAQIVEGAPYDVFVSADEMYPQTLFEKGLTLSAPKIYAEGQLVMWTMSEDIQPSLDVLVSDQIRHIAIANPATAPYGRAALSVLRASAAYDEIQDKLVYGESIAQVNQFILSGAAELGLTSKSVVLTDLTKDKGEWLDVDQSLYPPLKQAMVTIRNERGHEEWAQVFEEFLFSEIAQRILEDDGYGVIK